MSLFFLGLNPFGPIELNPIDDGDVFEWAKVNVDRVAEPSCMRSPPPPPPEPCRCGGPPARLRPPLPSAGGRGSAGATYPVVDAH